MARTRTAAAAAAAGVALLLTTVLGAGRLANSPGDGPVPEKSAPTPAARPGLSASGTVDVEDGVVQLFPLVAGEVVAVPGKALEGKTVEKDTPLLEIDPAPAQVAVRQAKAGIELARSKVAQARQGVAQQAGGVERLKVAISGEKNRLLATEAALQRLEKRGEFRNDDEVKAARAAVAAQKDSVRLSELNLTQFKEVDPSLQVQEAEAGVRVAEAKLAEAEQAVERCVRRAPSRGRVLRTLAAAGTLFSAQSRTPAFWFAPEGPLVVRADVEQEFASRVQVGKSAVVRDDSAASAGEWKGRVARVADTFLPKRQTTPLPDPFLLNEARTLECVVTLEPGQPELRVGQRVRVHIGE